MRTLLLFFILGALHSTSIAKPIKNSCRPLAEAGITNEGLAKLIVLSLNANMKNFIPEIKEHVAALPEANLDGEKCKPPAICPGFLYRRHQPDGTIQSIASYDLNKMQTKPVSLSISDYKVSNLEAKVLPYPETNCENLTCLIKFDITQFEASANFAVNFVNPSEPFINNTKINLFRSNSADAEMGLTQSLIFDPSTVSVATGSTRLADMANGGIRTGEQGSDIRYKPGSLQIDIPAVDIGTAYLNLPNASRRSLVKNYYNYLSPYREYGTAMKDSFPAFFGLNPNEEDDIYNFMRIMMRYTIYKAVHKIPGIETIRNGELAEDPLKGNELGITEDQIKKIWLSEVHDPISKNTATFEDRLFQASFGTMAEEAQFKNPDGFFWLFAGGQVINGLLGNDYVSENLVKPVASIFLLPIVKQAIDKELAGAKQKWDEIAKLPNLNLQNQATLSYLRERLERSTGADRVALKQRIESFKEQISNDWLSFSSLNADIHVDTENTYEGSLLALQVTDTVNDCKPTFSLPKLLPTDDYDIRIKLSISALQRYIQGVTTDPNTRDVCLLPHNRNVLTSDQCTSKGGTKLTMNQPPVLSCDSSTGKYNLSFDTKVHKEIIKNLFGIKENIGANFQARLDNCDGSPCLSSTSFDAKFKGFIFGTFFNGILTNTIDKALKQSGGFPIKIPEVSVKKVTVDKATCETTLDFDIKPKSAE